jgi:hypothetical protein
MIMKMAKRHNRVSGMFLSLFMLTYPCGITCIRAQTAEEPGRMQQIREMADENYRISTDLLNGEKYQYPYRSDRGTPFLQLQGEPLATVEIAGSTFHEQRIRYDAYNQQMILDFRDAAGTEGSLVLNNYWLDQVILGPYRFRLFTGDGGKEKFGQVIGEGEYTSVWFWEKKYLPDMQNGEQRYFFTDPEKKTVLSYRKQVCTYTGNRSLVRCLPEEVRASVKEFLKTNRIRVKKATLEEMEDLMKFVNQVEGAY